MGNAVAEVWSALTQRWVGRLARGVREGEWDEGAVVCPLIHHCLVAARWHAIYRAYPTLYTWQRAGLGFRSVP
jgi:hypothetical protein